MVRECTYLPTVRDMMEISERVLNMEEEPTSTWTVTSMRVNGPTTRRMVRVVTPTSPRRRSMMDSGWMERNMVTVSTIMRTMINIVVSGRMVRRVAKVCYSTHLGLDTMETSRMIKPMVMVWCSTPMVTGMMEIGWMGRSRVKLPTSMQMDPNTKVIGRTITKMEGGYSISPTMIAMRVNSRRVKGPDEEYTIIVQGISSRVSTEATNVTVMVISSSWMEISTKEVFKIILYLRMGKWSQEWKRSVWFLQWGLLWWILLGW